jgi:hypothetical protein
MSEQPDPTRDRTGAAAGPDCVDFYDVNGRFTHRLWWGVGPNPDTPKPEPRLRDPSRPAEWRAG